MSTDRDWEKWGKSNPYFGVFSDKKFLGASLNPKASTDFFRSGSSNIERLISHIKLLNHGKLPKFKQAVDFGCGVGRLSIPLADYAQKVTGLDVSSSMVNEARQNLPRGKKHVQFKVTNDRLTSLPRRYDLVYSYITLQHITPKRGEKIIQRLLEGLQPGGWAGLHITYAHEASAARRFVIKIRSFLPLHYALNILRGRPIKTPLMRMHCYNLAQVQQIFYKAGIKPTLAIPTNHGGYHGALIIGQKH